MSNDIAINVTGLPNMVSKAFKPTYLVVLEDGSSKSKTIKKFISLDKPELLQGFIQVKGIFCDSTEEEIIKNFSDILTSTSKDLILEVLIPWHKISYMRSLIFKQK